MADAHDSDETDRQQPQQQLRKHTHKLTNLQLVQKYTAATQALRAAPQQ